MSDANQRTPVYMKDKDRTVTTDMGGTKPLYMQDEVAGRRAFVAAAVRQDVGVDKTGGGSETIASETHSGQKAFADHFWLWVVVVSAVAAIIMGLLGGS